MHGYYYLSANYFFYYALVPTPGVPTPQVGI